MRGRSWRRAQRERVRTNRYQLARSLWGWSFRYNPEWIEESSVRWGKSNPLTVCSCEWCSYNQKKEAFPTVEDWD